MILTKNFKISDFAVSESYPELAKAIEFTELDKYKLYMLCQTILEPIVTEFENIIILSGKRTWELNEKVGGEPISDHLFHNLCCAVDITIPESNPFNVVNWIKTFINPAAWGQLIEYPDRNFIHISLPTPKHQGEILKK